MRCYWFYVVGLIGLFGGTAQEIRAQKTTAYTRTQVPIPDPVYVLNSTIIINGVFHDFTTEDTRKIKQVMVYKALDNPGTQAAAPQLRNLSPAGVIDITLPKRVSSQSFAQLGKQLGKQLGVRGPLLFALNGHPLDAPTVAVLRIAPAAIGQLHIIRPTAKQPATLVDVWLVAPPKTDLSKYPTGTIFIR